MSDQPSLNDASINVDAAAPETTTEEASGEPSSLTEAFEKWQKDRASTPDADKSLQDDKDEANPKEAPPEEAEKEKEDSLLEDHIKIRKQKKRLKRWEAELGERETKVKHVEELMTLWEKDPYEFLDKAKIDPRKWAERALNEPEDEAAKVRKELEEFKAEQERARLEREQEQEIQRALNTVKYHIENNIKDKEYLNISIEDGELSPEFLTELCWNDMVSYYQEYKKEIKVPQLLEIYEKQLRDQAEVAARRRERLLSKSSATKEVAPASRGSAPSEKRETKTLSNKDASSKAAPQKAMTPEEVFEELSKKHLSKYMK